MCVFEVYRCSSRKSRDLNALGSREVMVVMQVEIVVMVVMVVVVMVVMMMVMMVVIGGDGDGW